MPSSACESAARAVIDGLRQGSLRIAAGLFVIALSLSLAWEIAQMPAFGPAGQSLGLGSCAVAATWDAAAIVGLYLWGVVWTGRADWIRTAGTIGYGMLVGPGLLLGILAEIVAVHLLAWWDYRPSMPRIPIVQVGLWPTLSLAVITPLSAWTAQWVLALQPAARGT